MAPVYFKSSTYDTAELKPAIFDLLEKCGRQRIQAGTRVLIKPNFLLPAKPESAILTHPGIVAATCEYALARGARVLVADSPATGTFTGLLKKGGFKRALGDLDVAIRPGARKTGPHQTARALTSPGLFCILPGIKNSNL